MDRGMDGGHGEKPLRMSMRRIHIPHLKGGKFVRFPLDLYRRHLWCPAVFWPAKNFHHIIIWGIQRGALALHSGRFRIPRGALQCGAFAPHPPEAARCEFYDQHCRRRRTHQSANPVASSPRIDVRLGDNAFRGASAASDEKMPSTSISRSER